MQLTLTDEELESLTGKRTRPAQRRVLNYLGIDCRMRPDGSIVVLRSTVEKTLGPTEATSPRRANGPRFDLVK